MQRLTMLISDRLDELLFKSLALLSGLGMLVLICGLLYISYPYCIGIGLLLVTILFIQFVYEWVLSCRHGYTFIGVLTSWPLDD